MNAIDYQHLAENIPALRAQWADPGKPFGYIVFDGILKKDAADEILKEYPDVTNGTWNGITYLHQKNKYSMNSFGSAYPHLQGIFDELNGEMFRKLLSDITGIDGLMGDADLFGGGLHQSLNGAFLDVHVDFNLHDKTRHHRRLNAIIYMNNDWKEAYNGYLELWDMEKKKMIEYIAPAFNRLTVFETNEVSYHGHPKPLNTPNEITRKSLAVYYYTKDRPEHEIVNEHNTLYVNTQGTKGFLKITGAAVKAFKERISGKK